MQGGIAVLVAMVRVLVVERSPAAAKQNGEMTDK